MLWPYKMFLSVLLCLKVCPCQLGHGHEDCSCLSCQAHEVGPASQVAHWDHTRPAFGCVWVPQRRFLLVVFHQRRLFLPVLSCPRRLILSVLLSPQRLFLLVKFHSLRSYQTSYLLLLTSTSEDVPASELVPTDVIPDQLSDDYLGGCSC